MSSSGQLICCCMLSSPMVLSKDEIFTFYIFQQLGQCKARPFNFVLVCLFFIFFIFYFLFFIFCFATHLVWVCLLLSYSIHRQWQSSITKTHWPPMGTSYIYHKKSVKGIEIEPTVPGSYAANQMHVSQSWSAVRFWSIRGSMKHVPGRNMQHICSCIL